MVNDGYEFMKREHLAGRMPFPTAASKSGVASPREDSETSGRVLYSKGLIIRDQRQRDRVSAAIFDDAIFD